MRKFTGLTKRNLQVYFCDIQSVAFSMMTPLIVLALYLLFLKATFIDELEYACAGLSGLISDGDVDAFANGLLLAGILGSALITVPYNTLTTIVRDRENKIDYDISATPIGRVQIILAYYTASALSSIIMTSTVTACGLVILNVTGDLYLTAGDLLRLFGTVVLGSVSSTSLFMIIVLFMRSSSASAAFFGMLSAASGFIIGAYIPVSEFSETVQTICNIFPGSSVTALLRSLLLGRLTEHVEASLGGVDNGAFVQEIRCVFTFSPRMFGYDLTTTQTVAHVVMTAAVCIAAIAFIYPRVYKRR